MSSKNVRRVSPADWLHSPVAVLSAAALVAAAVCSSSAAAQSPFSVDDRMLLEGVGIDAALLAKFADGKPFDAAEREPLVSALAGLRQCSQLDLDRYGLKFKHGDDLTKPEARGRLWEIRGRLVGLAPLELTDEEITRLYPELDELKPGDPRRRMYRCEIEVGDGPQRATVYSTRVPKSLAERPAVEGRAPLERIAVQAIVLKTSDAAAPPMPLVVARRLAWFPATPLGDLGFDYGLYDDVRLESHDLIREHDCFYQLLAAMQRADFDALLAVAPRERSVVPLFNAPATMHGQVVALVGTARRAVAVVVKEPEVQERFGIRKYYEVAIYTADSQQNPLIFNILELPPGFPEGDNIHASVRIPGTFLTGFYYHRDATPDEQARGIQPKLQKAPLLLGKSLQWLKEPTQEASTSWVFGGLVVAAFVVLAIAGARLMQSENRMRNILRKRNEPPTGTSLNDAPVEYQARPDFSNLDGRDDE